MNSTVRTKEQKKELVTFPLSLVPSAPQPRPAPPLSPPQERLCDGHRLPTASLLCRPACCPRACPKPLSLGLEDTACSGLAVHPASGSSPLHSPARRCSGQAAPSLFSHAAPFCGFSRSPPQTLTAPSTPGAFLSLWANILNHPVSLFYVTVTETCIFKVTSLCVPKSCLSSCSHLRLMD